MWSESITVAQDVLRYWTSRKTVNTAADDLRTLSLHVMSRAGFGKSFKFQGRPHRAVTAEAKTATTDTTMDYKESLKVILENCVLIFALGPKNLGKSWLPQKLRTIHEACITFQKYMTEVYEDEKRSSAEGRTGDRNFMASLIRASQDEKSLGGGLTESEIYGNSRRTFPSPAANTTMY